MASLRTLAQKACVDVPGIEIVKLNILLSGTVHEAVIDYKGHNRVVTFLYEDLQAYSEEWLLDDVIAQFEKFKTDVDKAIAENSLIQ